MFENISTKLEHNNFEIPRSLSLDSIPKSPRPSEEPCRKRIINSLNLAEINHENDVEDLVRLTPRSLSLSVYKIYLDLGPETLEILKHEGLKSYHCLLDLGPRFLTSCYISSYLNAGKYFAVAETDIEINSLEICDSYVELSTGINKDIDCTCSTIKDFCTSSTWNKKSFDFILIQRNLATLDDTILSILLLKITKLIDISGGKVMAHYIENFPDKPGGIPIMLFKRVLGKITSLNLTVRTILYSHPMNLRMLCITKKIKTVPNI